MDEGADVVDGSVEVTSAIVINSQAGIRRM